MKTKRIPDAIRLRPRGAPLPAPKTILSKKDKAQTRRALNQRFRKEILQG